MFSAALPLLPKENKISAQILSCHAVGDFSALQATHSRKGASERFQEIQGPDPEDVKPEDLDIDAAESENSLGGLSWNNLTLLSCRIDEEKGGEDGSHSDEGDPAEAALTKSKEAKAVATVATACASSSSGDSGQHDVEQTQTCSNLSSSPRDLEQKDEDASMIYATSVSTDYKSSACEKCGSCWWSDGHEYHGELAGGLPQGVGTHLFPNGDRLVCSFKKGVPIASGTLRDAQGDYYDVEYCTSTSIRNGAKPVKCVATVEPIMLSYYCQYGASCACIKIHCGPHDADGQAGTEFKRKVSGQLVWARPKHADMPLWNAEQVKGNIVVIMSGPTTHAPLPLKIIHAHAAGARAVILVDAAVTPALPPPDTAERQDRRVPFTRGGGGAREMSGGDRVDAIDAGVVVDGFRKGRALCQESCQASCDTFVETDTLVCSVTNESRGLLSTCEGLAAEICMDISLAGERKSNNGGEDSRIRGVVVIPMQKRGAVLSKEHASLDTLMANFLRERRKELSSGELYSLSLVLSFSLSLCISLSLSLSVSLPLALSLNCPLV
jgi:hypothetical protein